MSTSETETEQRSVQEVLHSLEGDRCLLIAIKKCAEVLSPCTGHPIGAKLLWALGVCADNAGEVITKKEERLERWGIQWT